MSAGELLYTRYTDNAGNVHPIRVQPETATTWNPAVQAPATAGFGRMRVSGSRRGIGNFARMVTLRALAGEEPDGYRPRSVTSIPVFTAAAWNALTEDQEVTYLGAQWNVVGKRAEKIR